MNRRLRVSLAAGVLSGALVLTGCSSGESQEGQAAPSTSDSQEGHDSQGGMEHPMDGEPVPEGMTTAADPKYPVGTEVTRSEEHTSELQSRGHLVCRLLLEKTHITPITT